MSYHYLGEDVVDNEDPPDMDWWEYTLSQGVAIPTPSFQWPIQPMPWVRKNSFAAKYPSGKQHGALDMGKAGDAVLATAPGTVLLARATGDSRGNAIVLDLGGGWEVRHYHLDNINVAKGDVVAVGQQIGVVGRTGLPSNSGPHLHFEVRKDGSFFDPSAYLSEGESGGGIASLTPAVLGGALLYFLMG